MGYPRARRRLDRTDPHPTRERLIDVTVELIGEAGIDGVELAEVVARAGVTTGALYHHFRDMPELLEVAMARRFPVGVRDSLTMIREALRAAETLAEFQTAMATLTEVAHASQHRPRRVERAHALALAFGHESLREVLARQQSEMTAELTALMVEVQQRGWLRNDLSPKAVAVFVQACAVGRIVDDVTDDPVDPDDWNRLIIAVLNSALAAPAPAGSGSTG